VGRDAGADAGDARVHAARVAERLRARRDGRALQVLSLHVVLAHKLDDLFLRATTIPANTTGKKVSATELRRLNRQLKPRLIPFKILPHMEGPSPRQNHKKKLGVGGINLKGPRN
jgi:hypothetical protein